MQALFVASPRKCPRMSIATAISPLRRNRPLLFLVLGVAAGNLPLVLLHMRNLWQQPQYQYFPVVVIAIAWLIRRGAQWRPEPLDSRWDVPAGLVVIGIACLSGVAATWLQSPWLGTASAVLSLGGVLLVLRRWLQVENALGIWLLSLLILRAPMNLDTRLAFYLQGLTARVSGALLDMLGVVNLVEGNTIVLADRHLFVEEACSGIVSLMAIVACCAILAVWQHRPAPHAVVLTISGAFWAAILNTLRITTLAVTLDVFAIDLTSGWKHEALGLLLFAGTLGLTYCTDRLLLFLLTPVKTAETELFGDYSPGLADNPLTRMFNYLVEPALLFRAPPVANATAEEPQPADPEKLSLPRLTPALVFGAIFMVLGVAQAGRAAFSVAGFNRAEPLPQILALSEPDMPATLAGMQRAGFAAVRREVSDVFGEHSRQWEYTHGDDRLLLSVDFVFLEFHDLAQCYQGLGWKVLSRQTMPRPNSDQRFVEVMLGKPDGQRAWLLFGDMDRTGRNVPPPESSLTSGLAARLAAASSGIPGGVCQIQALLQSGSMPTDAQRWRTRKAFFEFCDAMASAARGGQQP